MQQNASTSSTPPTKRDACRAGVVLYLGQMNQSQFTDANHKASLLSLRHIDGEKTLFEVMIAHDNAAEREMVWSQWFSVCKTDTALAGSTQSYLQSLISNTVKADAGTTVHQKIEILRLFRKFHNQMGQPDNPIAGLNVEYVFASHRNELKLQDDIRDDLRVVLLSVLAKNGKPITEEDLPSWLRQGAVMSPFKSEQASVDARSSAASAPTDDAQADQLAADDGDNDKSPGSVVKPQVLQMGAHLAVAARNAGYVMLLVCASAEGQSLYQSEVLPQHAQWALLALALCGVASVTGSQVLPDNPPSLRPFVY